ncbi:MAG: iron-sulfur cluster assembly protein [Nitrospinaceae bacterium]|jgi:metal-sulfur cluster biosynthetic enzyme
MMVLPLPLKNKEVLKEDMANARDEVHQQLAEVYDPELDQPLTELGFIGGVDIAGDKVTVRFRLPTYWCAANFAYMMSSDIRERVSELPWVKRVDVLLQDHFHDEEINEGIKHGKTFLTAFPDATENLDELRETFRVKAFQARQERVLRWLKRKGIQEEAILRMQVGDLEQLLKKRQVAKLVERYLNIRQERGLPGEIGAEAFTHADGSSIDPGGLQLLLNKASSTRLSMEFNTAFCSGLLKTRYGEDKQGLQNAALQKDKTKESTGVIDA